MTKAICYLTTGSRFQRTMLLNSVRMLREYNKDIPVRVFFISNWQDQGNDYSQIAAVADKLGIDLQIRKPTAESLKHNYIFLNRFYLSECEEKALLYLDADTFIFGDVGRLFDKHADVDFAGMTEDYIPKLEDWRPELLEQTYQWLDGETDTPLFNGGIGLWNNHHGKRWGEYVEVMCDRLMTDELPIYEWLHAGTRGGYYRDQFALSFYVSQDQDLEYRVLPREDAVCLFKAADLAVFEEQSTTIFHCFNQNWHVFAQRLGKQKTKPEPRRHTGLRLVKRPQS